MRTLLSRVLNILGTSLGVLAVFLGPLTAQAGVNSHLPETFASLTMLYSVVVILLIAGFGLRYLGASIGSIEDNNKK